MKAPAAKQTKRWLGGAALLAFLAWYGFGLMSGTEPTATNGNVKAYGLVVKQGTYTWYPGMTVRGLIAEAGGTTTFAQIKKVKVFDPKASAPVKLWRKTLGWMVSVVNAANEKVASTWEACGLPEDAPDFSMRPPTNLKAVVNLRKPSTDVALSPGDVVIVEEILVSF
jgi:hypothetical protein